MSYFITILLIICLFMVLFLCKQTGDKSFLSPQSLMTISFLPGLVMLLAYIDRWQMQYNVTVVFALLGGPLIFLLVGVLSGRKVIRLGLFPRNNNSIDDIEIWKYYFFMAFEAATFLLILSFIVRSVGAFSSIGNLLHSYNYLTAHEEVDLPTITTAMRVVTLNMGKIWAVILSFYYREKRVKKNKRARLAVINYIITLAVSVEFGARGTAIDLLTGSVVIFMMMNVNKESKLSQKTQCQIICLILLGGLAFQQAGNWMGREDSFNFWDYLAMYMAAPTKNMSTGMISETLYDVGEGIGDNRTFVHIINWFALKYGHPEWYHHQGYPSNYVNGEYIGNVYSAYTDYLFDGGIPYFVFCISLAAILSTFFYKRARVHIVKMKSDISLELILYSSMAFGIAFSFFANEFWLNIAHIGFIRSALMLLVLKFFLFKVKLRARMPCDAAV